MGLRRWPVLAARTATRARRHRFGSVNDNGQAVATSATRGSAGQPISRFAPMRPRRCSGRAPVTLPCHVDELCRVRAAAHNINATRTVATPGRQRNRTKPGIPAAAPAAQLAAVAYPHHGRAGPAGLGDRWRLRRAGCRPA
jgi:hypothetical protein